MFVDQYAKRRFEAASADREAESKNVRMWRMPSRSDNETTQQKSRNQRRNEQQKKNRQNVRTLQYSTTIFETGGHFCIGFDVVCQRRTPVKQPSERENVQGDKRMR